MTGSQAIVRFSLVIPVYRNEENVPALVDRVAAMNASLGDFEAVFVVDGSPDRSYLALRERLEQAEFASQLIGLSRNFGSFAAIRQGLAAARGSYFSVMAADLQEPAELILTFFRRLESGEVDVVVGARAARDDPFLSSVSSRVFWWTYRTFVQPEVPAGGVDVFGCNLVVRDALLSLHESNSSLVGLLFWLGFRRESVEYRRLAREHGKSGWSFRRKVRYLLDSAFAFTDLPISLLATAGALGVLISIVLAVAVVSMRLAGRIQVLGYTPIMLLLLFSLSVTLFALGIVGVVCVAHLREQQGQASVRATFPRDIRRTRQVMTHFVHPNGLCETASVGERTRIWAFAHVLAGASIGEDCNVCDGVFVENDVVVGNRVTIKCGVQLWDGVRLEDDVFVGPNATFSNDKFPRSKQHQESVPETRVSKGASIGANATILPGIVIGTDAMVGAGAVVTRDVPPKAIVVGNPARIVGYVDAVKRSDRYADSLVGSVASTGTSLPGVTLHRLSAATDLRGSLAAAEFGPDVPFEAKRVFLVYDVPSKDVRGEHAHRACSQFLVCVRGRVSVLVDDGRQREEILLDRPDVGLLIPPMVWGIQYKYSADAVLMVLASEHYDPGDYIRDYDEYLAMLDE